MSDGKLIKDSGEIIKELMDLIKRKDVAIEKYKEINESNKLIIKGYQESVDTLMETVRKKDMLIDSLMQNTDGQYETTQVLLNKVKELQEHISNLKKIRPN